jgi:hypothetical protein
MFYKYIGQKLEAYTMVIRDIVYLSYIYMSFKILHNYKTKTSNE